MYHRDGPAVALYLHHLSGLHHPIQDALAFVRQFRRRHNHGKNTHLANSRYKSLTNPRDCPGMAYRPKPTRLRPAAVRLHGPRKIDRSFGVTPLICLGQISP
jgi:hypothetical protein